MAWCGGIRAKHQAGQQHGRLYLKEKNASLLPYAHIKRATIALYHTGCRRQQGSNKHQYASVNIGAKRARNAAGGRGRELAHTAGADGDVCTGAVNTYTAGIMAI